MGAGLAPTRSPPPISEVPYKRKNVLCLSFTVFLAHRLTIFRISVFSLYIKNRQMKVVVAPALLSDIAMDVIIAWRLRTFSINGVLMLHLPWLLLPTHADQEYTQRKEVAS